jgi:hypothetical protein
MLLKRSPRGRISYPRNRGSVPRLFRAKGTIENLPANQQLILVVEVAGLMWPKGQVQPVDGTWSAEVYEGGSPSNGKFTLSLFRVSERGCEEVVTWLERGRRTGDYPGLGRIRDGVKLHSIGLRLKRL